jgi:hypothetical protein
MSDVYVYLFRTSNRPNGKKMLSTRPATLGAIKDRGEAVMESQIVVDHTELDGDGFLVETFGNDSAAIEHITAQIRSLEVRATSRDNEALASADGIEQYMLSLESRELRKQARDLKRQRTEIIARELGDRTDKTNSVQFGAGLATE